MIALLPYLALALSLLAIAAFFWAFSWIRTRLTQLYGHDQPDSLGNVLTSHTGALQTLRADLQSATQATTALDARITATAEQLTSTDTDLQTYTALALRHFHLHTYSLTGDSGPDSNIVIITDAHGTGLLISILAGKTTRIYAREVVYWKASQLSDAEQTALQEAQTKATQA